MKKTKDTAVKEKVARKAANPRFNAIDFLIILLIVACLGGLVLRFTVLDDLWTTRDLEQYALTFTASDLSFAQCQAIADAVSSANADESWIYMDDGTTKIGDLIITSNYMQNREPVVFKNPDGSITSAVPDETISDEDVRWSVTATILCVGKISEENGFLLNGRHHIAPNAEMKVRIINCDFSMRVIEIDKYVEAAG